MQCSRSLLLCCVGLTSLGLLAGPALADQTHDTRHHTV